MCDHKSTHVWDRRGENPFGTEAKRVFSVTGGKLSTLTRHPILNLTLKILAGDELYRLRLRYFDLLQRLWIYTLSRLPFDHFERPEANELNHLIFLYTRFYGVNYSRNRLFGVGFARFSAELLFDRFDKLYFVHEY
jgi:hypothetical protein